MAERLDATRPDHVLRAASLLREGKLVVVPTDTVYGLACSVFHQGAVARVFAAKQRLPDAPVPVLFGTAADLPLLVATIPRSAWKLIDRFWPGPLTLVLPARPTISPPLVRNGKVGVRIPGNRSCLALLQSLGEPIVGTSANISGHPPAETAAAAEAQLGDVVDAILAHDEGIALGRPSTVVEVTDEGATIHRAGAVSLQDVRDVLGLSVTLTPAH